MVVIAVVDKNNTLVDLTDVDLNINDKKEDEAKR